MGSIMSTKKSDYSRKGIIAEVKKEGSVPKKILEQGTQVHQEETLQI